MDSPVTFTVGVHGQNKMFKLQVSVNLITFLLFIFFFTQQSLVKCAFDTMLCLWSYSRTLVNHGNLTHYVLIDLFLAVADLRGRGAPGASAPPSSPTTNLLIDTIIFCVIYTCTHRAVTLYLANTKVLLKATPVGNCTYMTKPFFFQTTSTCEWQCVYCDHWVDVQEETDHNVHAQHVHVHLLHTTFAIMKHKGHLSRACSQRSIT